MAKAEWGTKRVCPHCAMRFYDMKKKPPVCPGCGTAISLESAMKTRRARPPIEEKAPKPAPVSEEDLETLPIEEEDSDETAIIEDADELGEDDINAHGVVDIGAESKEDL